MCASHRQAPVRRANRRIAPLWASVLVGLLALQPSCTAQPALDDSLLTGDPCAAPCWQGIVPGQSGEEEVIGTLEASQVVNPDTIWRGDFPVAGVPLVQYAWRHHNPKSPQNYLYLRDGVVLRIETYLDYELTLGEVVTRFGPPEGVYAQITAFGEWLGYTVVLDYPEIGLTFWSLTTRASVFDRVYREGVGLLREDLAVTTVTYYAPTSLEDALTYVFLLEPAKADAVLAYEQAWPGFGEVPLGELDRCGRW